MFANKNCKKGKIIVPVFFIHLGANWKTTLTLKSGISINFQLIFLLFFLLYWILEYALHALFIAGIFFSFHYSLLSIHHTTRFTAKKKYIKNPYLFFNNHEYNVCCTHAQIFLLFSIHFRSVSDFEWRSLRTK